MEGYGKRVLVVDDDHHARFLVGSLLDYAGYNVVPACHGLDALSELAKRQFDAVVTDHRMPIMDGVELLKRIHKEYPGLPVIFVSGTLPEDFEDSGCRPFANIGKPFDSARLRSVVHSATQRSGPADRRTTNKHHASSFTGRG